MKIDGEEVTEIQVENGSDKILSIIANEGYNIISVKVNDVKVELNNGLLELKDIQQDQNIVVQTEKIEDEINNEENETGTENIVEDNTTIDNEIEENITNIEDTEKNQDNENVENKTEESYNNPPTGDNIFVYGVIFIISLIGASRFYSIMEF